MLRILVLLTFLLPTTAYSDVAACRALSKKAPKNIGPLPRESQRNVEDQHPGLGFSSGYAGSGLSVTIYFYDLQYHQITSDVATAAFHSGARSMQEGMKMKGTPMKSVNAYQPTVGTLFQAVSHGPDSRGLGNYMALGVHRNCLIKLRLTIAGSDVKKQKSFMDNLMVFFHDQITR